MISVNCECGKSLNVADRLAGKLGRCPSCGAKIRIPVPARPPSRPERKKPEPVSEKGVGPGPPESAPVPLVIGGGPAAAVEEDPLEAVVVAPSEVESLAMAVAAGTPRFVRAPAGHLSASNVFAIIGGFATLATIFIPWMAAEGRVLMSWDMLRIVPGTFVAFVILAWAIGVATIILTLTVKGLGLAIAHASVGFTGLFILVVGLAAAGPAAWPPGGAGGLPGSESVGMVTVSAILLAAMLISTNIGLRVASLPVRIVQGASAGGLAILSVIQLFRGIGGFGGLPADMRGALVFHLLFLSLVTLCLIAGCVLASVDAAMAKTNKRVLARASLCLLYAAMLSLFAYAFIMLAASELPGLALSLANFAILLGTLLFLVCSGIASIVCWLQERTLDAAPTALEADRKRV